MTDIPKTEVPPMECPNVLLPTPANLSNLFGTLASNAERMVLSEIEEIKEEGEKIKEVVEDIRKTFSPYDPNFKGISIPEKEFEIMIQRLIEEYHMYIPAKILELLSSVVPSVIVPIPGLGISVDVIKIATDREYLNTVIAEIEDVDKFYDLLPSEYKLFNGDFGLESKELKKKQIQDFVKNEITKAQNNLMFGGFGALIGTSPTKEVWETLSLPGLPIPLNLDVKGSIDAALADGKSDLEKVKSLKEIKIEGFDIAGLLGGEFNDIIDSTEFKVARINQKLKEFEASWQTFLLKTWMGKVTEFFSKIGLSQLTELLNIDFCKFCELIGLPKQLTLPASVTAVANETVSPLSNQTVSITPYNPPPE